MYNIFTPTQGPASHNRDPVLTFEIFRVTIPMQKNCHMNLYVNVDLASTSQATYLPIFTF